MEKESYQPSAEEMTKAQEMADETQIARGEAAMTWDERRASYLREQDAHEKDPRREEKQKAWEEEVEKRIEEQKKRDEEKPEDLMTWSENNASHWRENLFKRENELKEKGLGELSNIKFKAYVRYDREDNPITTLYEGNVDGHKIVVKAEIGNKRHPGNEVSIDGLPLPEKERNLFLKKIERYLHALDAAHFSTERAIKENRQIIEKSRQDEEEAKKEKERIENEQKASEILKSILGGEKDENN